MTPGRRALPPAVLLLAAQTSFAEPPVSPCDVWGVIDTDQSLALLLEDLKPAVAATGFGAVTPAGPTGARGIEAPIRFSLTDDGDGTAALSWKTPGFVFAPYLDAGGTGLKVAADELDPAFRTIAEAASR